MMNITLIPWTEANKQDLVRVCNETNRRYLADTLPYPYTEADADFWLGRVWKQDGVTGIFRAICVDGRIVGNISVEQKSGVSRKDSEIGYLLAVPEWSKGIMTAAAGQICEIAFDVLDIIRITGNVYSPNLASRRVLEKNGFNREGVKKNAICKDGNIYDLYIYGKCR